MNDSLLSAMIGVGSALAVVVLNNLLAKTREIHSADLAEKRRIYSSLLVAMADLKSDCNRLEYQRKFVEKRTLFLVVASSKLLHCFRDYEKYILDNNQVDLGELEKKERSVIRLMRKDLKISNPSLIRKHDLPEDVYLYNLNKKLCR